MKKFFKKNAKEFFFGALILLIALTLRIYNLTIIPIFGDEAIYVRWSQVMRAEPTLRFLPLSDGKQPLFMWLVIPFFKIFSDPLFAARTVSVLSGIGTLVGIFVLSFILFKSRRLSLVSSLLYALSPFSVFFDRLALADSLLSFFGVWALIFTIIAVKKVRLDSAMLAGFSLGGAFLTKSPAIFFALLLPLSLILYKYPKSFKQKFYGVLPRPYGRGFLSFLRTTYQSSIHPQANVHGFLKICYKLSIFVFLFTAIYAIAFGLYNILRLGPNFNMIALRNLDYVYPFSHFFASPLDPLKPFLSRIFEYFWLLGPWVLVFLFVLGITLGLKEKRKETILLLVWGIAPLFAVAEFSKNMTARYVYFTIPYLFIIAGLAFQSSKSTLYKNLSTFLLVIYCVFSLLSDFQILTKPEAATLPRSERSGYLEEWTAGYGIKEASDIIRTNYLANPGQKIVVGTEGYFGTLPDGLQVYLNDVPLITVIGVGLSFDEVPESLYASQKAGNKTYLVVNNTRFNGNAQVQGLNPVAVYGKAVRPDGSREALLVFELTDESLRTQKR